MRKRFNRQWVLSILTVLIIGYSIFPFTIQFNLSQDLTPSFEGNSKDLQSTQIVATLDEPIKKEHNVVWSVGFLSLWKSLQSDFIKEDIRFEDNLSLVDRLNSAKDLSQELSSVNIEKFIGYKKDFNGKLDVVHYPDNALLIHSKLKSNIRFTTPYFDTDTITFSDQKIAVSSFGIGKSNRGNDELREQIKILYAKAKRLKVEEFVIDLNVDDQKNQLIVAQIELKSTLQETLNYVNKKIIASEKVIRDGNYTIFNNLKFGSNSVIKIPNIYFKIQHNYSELENQKFENEKLKDKILGLVRDTIEFKLDKNGADLRVESLMLAASRPTDFIFDKPFLVIMRDRKSKAPYFVVWIENDILLSKI